MQPFSKALPDATRTFRKLRRDVSGCTSVHNDYYVGTYQMLRRDIISSMSSVKLQKKQMKKPSIEPKKRIFAQCSLSFHPKIPLKHLYFAVAIKVITYQYGNSLAQKNIYKTACPTQKKGKRRNDTSPWIG